MSVIRMVGIAKLYILIKLKKMIRRMINTVIVNYRLQFI